MNFDASTLAQVPGGPDQVIGYGELQQSAFKHGWDAALGAIFAIERTMLANSIVEELGMPSHFLIEPWNKGCS